MIDWVLEKGSNLSYHNTETLLFTIDSIDPYYGNLNKHPEQEPS